MPFRSFPGGRACVTTGPVSRILSPSRKAGRGTVIPLGPTSRWGSSDLPGSWTRRAGPCPPPVLSRPSLAGRESSAEQAGGSSPIWSCSVWGLPCPAHYCPGGALLPHLFTLTPTNRGGMFSVALSVGPPLKASLPDVIRHTALWSSDFPPPPRAASPKRTSARQERPSGPLATLDYMRWPRRAFRRSGRGPALPAWFPHIPLYPASQPIGVPAF